MYNVTFNRGGERPENIDIQNRSEQRYIFNIIHRKTVFLAAITLI